MRHIRIVFPVVLILFGWWLRVYQIDDVAFRGDEAFTVQNWVLSPIGETLTSNTIVIDPHPPLSYTMFWIWGQLAGISEFSLRLLPALINLLGIAAIYSIGRMIVSDQASVFMAAMWALHAFLIWHSQDARNYAIWSGLSVIALAAFFRALKRNNLADWGIYTLAALLASYTYYLEVFNLLALNLSVFAIYSKNRKILLRWISSQVFIAVALIPWYLILFGKLQTGLGYGGTAGGFSPEQLIFWFIPTLLFGEALTLPPLLSGIITCIIIFSWVIMWKRNWQQTLPMILLVIIPMIGLAIVSTRLNVFTPRYIMGSIPAYLVSLVALLSLRDRKIFAGYTIVGGWFILTFLAIYTYTTPALQKAPDWREITAYIDTYADANDIVIQTGVDAAFGYYYHRQAIPAQEIALPASAIQSESEIIATLQDVQNQVQSIWLTGKTIASWANYGVVDQWALANMQLVREQYIDGVPIRQFRNYLPTSDEYGDVDVTFEDTIKLLGTNIQPTEPDGTQTIWLYWQTERQTIQPLKLFIHLLGDINPSTGTPLWAQDDHFPLGGGLDSQTWQIGTIFRDVAYIPVHSLPAGTYQLTVGWYDPVTGIRLTTHDGSDSYVIHTFEVK